MFRRVQTVKNTATDLPLVMGDSYMSAYIPPTTEIGADAPIPASKRKTRRELQFGAKAAPIVDKVNTEKVPIVIQRRPYSSLSGANKIGPKI